MATLHHQVWIDASITTVYAAISTATGVSSWWDQQTEKEIQGDLVWEHSPPPAEGNAAIGLKVIERVPDQRVVLRCAYAPADATASEDWIGTTLKFELRKRADCFSANSGWMKHIPAQTILNFTHSGWADDASYLAFCNTAWGGVLASLKSTCEEN